MEEGEEGKYVIVRKSKLLELKQAMAEYRLLVEKMTEDLEEIKNTKEQVRHKKESF